MKKSDVVRPPEISVGFVSLGCPKNLVDTQTMAGVLMENGLTLAPSPEAADVIIVNTCAFIEEARKEAIDSIFSACELKITGRCKAVLVAGCLPQRYKDDLVEELPEVDGFIGLDDLRAVARITRAVAAGKSGLAEISPRSKRVFDPPVPGLVLTGGAYAYLKIAEGCNHRCTFCAIPSIRGRHRSRSEKKIVAEAEGLLAAGVKELVLVSQDVTAYGQDRNTDLAALLRKLARLGEGFWIRWLYGFPSRVNVKLLETMAALPQVCRYLDVPIQHSHPDILRNMGRAATAGQLERMVSRIRRIMPDASLRTTCLVGFPGEKDAHFRHLLAFVTRMQFDHLGVFPFSPEEDTPAEQMPGRPSRRAAERRRDQLMQAQGRIVTEKAQDLVDTETTVLLEQQMDDRTWLGRAYRDAPEIDGAVLVEHTPDLQAGQFVRARYTAQAGYDMKASVMAEA